MARRIRNIGDLQLVPHVNRRATNVLFTVPGWIATDGAGQQLPFRLLDPANGDVFSVVWDRLALEQLSDSLRLVAAELASTTVMQTLQLTVLSNLLGPLSIPMWLTKLGYILDNPWSTGCDLARRGARSLAEALLFDRTQGCRPVSLLGFSVGCRLIFYALVELAAMGAYGIVEDVVFMGAPIDEPPAVWRSAASVVAGRFINAYSNRDWLLKLMHYRPLFPQATNPSSVVAGLAPINNIAGLTNADVSDIISGHGLYAARVPTLLARLGFPIDPSLCSSEEEYFYYFGDDDSNDNSDTTNTSPKATGEAVAAAATSTTTTTTTTTTTASPHPVDDNILNDILDGKTPSKPSTATNNGFFLSRIFSK